MRYFISISVLLILSIGITFLFNSEQLSLSSEEIQKEINGQEKIKQDIQEKIKYHRDTLIVKSSNKVSKFDEDTKKIMFPPQLDIKKWLQVNRSNIKKYIPKAIVAATELSSCISEKECVENPEGMGNGYDPNNSFYHRALVRTLKVIKQASIWGEIKLSKDYSVDQAIKQFDIDNDQVRENAIWLATERELTDEQFRNLIARSERLTGTSRGYLLERLALTELNNARRVLLFDSVVETVAQVDGFTALYIIKNLKYLSLKEEEFLRVVEEVKEIRNDPARLLNFQTIYSELFDFAESNGIEFEI